MSIIVKNISKLYGTQKALNDVSFEIKTGEIVGFLGPNGAGKSTMMKIITGFIPQTKGEVFVNDFNINENSLKIRQEIGYLPEHNPLYLDMYIKEYLEFVAGLYKLKSIKQNISKIIEQTGLTLEQHKKIGALSKGYRQRVGLAQALIHNPKVLILDEPTTGLDPNQILEIRNLIREVGKEKTVMLSTHIMQEVEAICDRVIIIDKGKIVADDNAKNLQTYSNKNEQSVTVEFKENIEIEKLQEINGVVKVLNINEKTWTLISNSDKDLRETIFHFAVNGNYTILHLNKQTKTLETVFHELTQK